MPGFIKILVQGILGGFYLINQNSSFPICLMATGSLSGGNTDLRITHKELLSVDCSINQRKKIFK